MADPRHPHVPADIILGVGVFLDDVNTGIGGQSKAAYPPQCGWASSHQRSQSKDRLKEEKLLPLSICLSTGTLASPGFGP